MENLANTSRKGQKLKICDPEGTEERVRSFILWVLIVGLVGNFVCLFVRVLGFLFVFVLVLEFFNFFFFN